MAGGMGHTGGLTNPRPWRGRCRAGCSNTGGPPLPRKRAPLQKKNLQNTKKVSVSNINKLISKNLFSWDEQLAVRPEADFLNIPELSRCNVQGFPAQF